MKASKNHKRHVAQDRLVIAVVSDVHAYEGIEPDKAPSHCCVTENDPTKNPLVGLRDFIGRATLSAELLFCPGDLGDKAQPLAIQHVWRELHSIKHLLRAKRLIATTGNHDVDSRYAHNGYDAKGMLQALDPMYPFPGEQMNDRYWSRHFVTITSGVCRILVLNSSAFHGEGQYEQRQRYEYEQGRVSDHTLNLIRKDLEGTPKALINILLCHHHPHPHSELRLGDADLMIGGVHCLSFLARAAWQHQRAAHYRQLIGFTGVFIATDINWNEQVKSLGDGRLDPETHRQFAKAAFTTEILQSLVESMLYRAGRAGKPLVERHRRVRFTAREEVEIARELIASWHIDRAIPSLEGVQIALSRRLSQIRVMASQEASRPDHERGERVAEIRFLHLDFLTAAGVAVEIFNAKAREREARWALLFDELELAPQWIRSILIRFLRSVDERFLFKISLSPYSVDLKKEMEGVDSAGAKQDFEPIRLWYVNKEHGFPFCRELLKGMLEARNLPAWEPERLFGSSAFTTDKADWSQGTAYRADSTLGALFKSLEERDPSFRGYLQRRGIDVRAMHTVEGTQRAADLRKARSIVALRAYFRGPEGAVFKGRIQGRRSRKVPTIYGGATSLFAMVEGNPRWFIGIVGELLNKAKKGSIPKPMQVRHVLDAADIFRAMLKTIPCGPVGESKRGLLSLLDPVGEYFARAAIDDPFDPDPPCSFVVDQGTGEEELRALGMALNAGAIVYAPDEGDVGILESLRGKRFRLSYILAPHYFIPLVLGRSLSLQEVLKRAGRRSHRRQEPTLFAPLDDSHE